MTELRLHEQVERRKARGKLRIFFSLGTQSFAIERVQRSRKETTALRKLTLIGAISFAHTDATG